MARYLLTVPDQLVGQLEHWLGGALHIAPPGMSGGVPVAGLDAVTEEEIAPVLARLGSGGPLYHGAPETHPLRADPPRPLSTAEQDRWEGRRT